MKMEIEKYFEDINKKVDQAYEIAEKSRKKGLDPVDYVEIPIARNMAERVVGLISSVAPQIKNKGIPERIEEFEKEYGKLDWRVAFKIAEEIAKEKYCKFKNKQEAMEIGIRAGIAYVTNGVVASPLEGFTSIKIRKRKDGKDYIAA
ncbi:DNA polymerase II large subunit, partial [bacterium]|nr:DNA polymerase II large subunit [bacterium]